MAEAKFTPGPWDRGTVADQRIGVYADSGYRVATVHDFNGRPENMANARLIAAAPALYDAADMALNTLLACCVSAGGVDDRKTILEAQQMLRAALKQALGE